MGNLNVEAGTISQNPSKPAARPSKLDNKLRPASTVPLMTRVHTAQQIRTSTDPRRSEQ
jgi:hypothetical protein